MKREDEQSEDAGCLKATRDRFSLYDPKRPFYCTPRETKKLCMYDNFATCWQKYENCCKDEENKESRKEEEEKTEDTEDTEECTVMKESKKSGVKKEKKKSEVKGEEEEDDDETTCKTERGKLESTGETVVEDEMEEDEDEED